MAKQQWGVSARWGTRELPPSSIHYFRLSAKGIWHAVCGAVATPALSDKAELHAGMASRGLCCQRCHSKAKADHHGPPILDSDLEGLEQVSQPQIFLAEDTERPASCVKGRDGG